MRKNKMLPALALLGSSAANVHAWLMAGTVIPI
jgi:hypothetical protein